MTWVVSKMVPTVHFPQLWGSLIRYNLLLALWFWWKEHGNHPLGFSYFLMICLIVNQHVFVNLSMWNNTHQASLSLLVSTLIWYRVSWLTHFVGFAQFDLAAVLIYWDKALYHVHYLYYHNHSDLFPMIIPMSARCLPWGLYTQKSSHWVIVLGQNLFTFALFVLHSSIHAMGTTEI